MTLTTSSGLLFTGMMPVDIDGDVGAAANGDPHVGLYERRSVVYAIADHRYGPAFRLEGPNPIHLVFRQYLCEVSIDAKLLSNRPGNFFAVAGQHRDLDAKLMQSLDGRMAFGPNDIRQRRERGTIASRSRTRMPLLAASPVVIDTTKGTASPKAFGQAMTRTVATRSTVSISKPTAAVQAMAVINTAPTAM